MRSRHSCIPALVGHAPGVAARTEATAFAAESHQMLGTAALAAHAQEAVLETTAREVILELALHLPRQFAALRRQMGLERRVVFLDKLVKKGLFRPVARVASRPTARTGLPATRQRQHDRILAISSWISDEQACRVPASVSPAAEC
jgi:hypothetical protein